MMQAAIPYRYGVLRHAWRSYCGNKAACGALTVLLSCAVLAVFAPWLTPQNPFSQAELNLLDARLPPWTTGSGGYIHVFGTDADGRDLYSAIVYGLRASMAIGILSGLAALMIGAALGLLAGFLRGAAESLIMRLVDMQLSFPPLMLALVLVASLGQGVAQVVIALVASQYAYFARTVHGTTLAESKKEYVEAAEAVPLPLSSILFCHLLPNVLPPLIVVGTVCVANSIVMEATLSFLGIGLPVSEPSLGGLICHGFAYMQSGRYWMSLYPGVALVVLVLAINITGDQLRLVFNPRLVK